MGQFERRDRSVYDRSISKIFRDHFELFTTRTVGAGEEFEFRRYDFFKLESLKKLLLCFRFIGRSEVLQFDASSGFDRREIGRKVLIF